MNIPLNFTDDYLKTRTLTLHQTNTSQIGKKVLRNEYLTPSKFESPIQKLHRNGLSSDCHRNCKCYVAFAPTVLACTNLKRGHISVKWLAMSIYVHLITTPLQFTFTIFLYQRNSGYKQCCPSIFLPPPGESRELFK